MPLSPHEGRIAVKVTAQMASEKLRLNVRNKPKRYEFSEKRVRKFVPLALLIGDQHGLAAGIGEQDGAVFKAAEIARRELAAVDQRKSDAVGQYRPQLFHQIKRQARPPRAVAMQKANGRIEPDTLRSGTAIVHEQRIKEREQRVTASSGGRRLRPIKRNSSFCARIRWSKIAK